MQQGHLTYVVLEPDRVEYPVSPTSFVNIEPKRWHQLEDISPDALFSVTFFRRE